MSEEFIVNMLILNGVNFHKFKTHHFEEAFEFWMKQLQQYKGFQTMDETCNYFLEQGGEPGTIVLF